MMKVLTSLLLTGGAVQASVVEPSKLFFTNSDIHCEASTGDSVIHLAAGGTHTCVMMVSDLSIDSETKYNGPIVKCWGTNINGAMGYGDTVTRGTNEVDMGLGLPFVNLDKGPQGSATAGLVTGELATCYIDPTDAPDSPFIRCWGQLGTKEATKKGDGPNETGSKLSLEGKNVESLSIGTKNGCYIGSGSAYCW